MRYLQALAVAVVAATLVMAAGCGQQATPGQPDQSDNGIKAAQVQKDLDQAKLDLKAAEDNLAAKSKELDAKTAAVADLQKQLDAANAKIAEITKTVQDAMKLAAPPAAAPLQPQ